ncbi:MAG TPA: trypsin-like peptidase domain-containing protein [Puia sp.]|nr:trypsin-like peptidase domain-containing protein [Puia sp.]
MKVRQLLAVVMVSAATAVGSVWGYGRYLASQDHAIGFSSAVSRTSDAHFAKYNENAASGPMIDFEKAATKGAPAVVHIRTLTKAKQVAGSPDMPDMQNNPFKDFFGDHFGDLFGGRGMVPQDQRASGSGVILSTDGYIVTNNHVIDGADELTVTLNNKKDFKAKVIGRDPSTDLAVIKIDAKDLPFLSFANSDNVHLGQWVLAIGYPLNLETTVTSGIVSAKSRNIGINSRNSKSPVETFIQTDAAVNPGNSGGALVNTDGDVIGINSAIASPTGSYAGYAYAIPSNLVQKVVNDIIKYGSSKRAYLGVMFGNDQMTEEERKKNDIKEGEGVFVMDVATGSAAAEAGIKKGDFVTKVNGSTVNTGTEMVEKISVLHPGDKINISFVHNGIEKTIAVILKESAGPYASMKQQVVDQLGASFEDLDKNTAAKLHLSGGVIVKGLDRGILTDQTRIKEGFIITRVNNTKVSTVDELKEAIKNSGNSAIITGVYPDQPETAYQYALNDLNSSK